MARPFCYRCHKAQLTCVCASVPRVANQTLVWIVQHPRERFHSLGTARFARLGLERVVVDAWHKGRTGPPPRAPEQPALLYPGADAQPLGRVGDEAPGALVVLDGTWAHAKRMHRDDPWLRSLPCYSLESPEPSGYRIRKEPALECVSTIESIVAALTALEPQTPGLGGLLAAFSTMIDEQIRLRDEATEARLSGAVLPRGAGRG